MENNLKRSFEVHYRFWRELAKETPSNLFGIMVKEAMDYAEGGDPPDLENSPDYIGKFAVMNVWPALEALVDGDEERFRASRGDALEYMAYYRNTTMREGKKSLSFADWKAAGRP